MFEKASLPADRRTYGEATADKIKLLHQRAVTLFTVLDQNPRPAAPPAEQTPDPNVHWTNGTAPEADVPRAGYFARGDSHMRGAASSACATDGALDISMSSGDERNPCPTFVPKPISASSAAPVSGQVRKATGSTKQDIRDRRQTLQAQVHWLMTRNCFVSDPVVPAPIINIEYSHVSLNNHQTKVKVTYTAIGPYVVLTAYNGELKMKFHIDDDSLETVKSRLYSRLIAPLIYKQVEEKCHH